MPNVIQLLHCLTGHLDYVSMTLPYEYVPSGDDLHSPAVFASEFPFGYGSVDTIYVSLLSLALGPCTRVITVVLCVCYPYSSKPEQ